MGCGCNYNNGCVVQDMICYMRMRFVIPWMAVWIRYSYVGSRDSRDLTFGRLFRRAMSVNASAHTDKSSQPVVVFV
jgi:hypothetical protein